MIKNTPWEFGHRYPNGRETCCAVVVNGLDQVLFDDSNADVRTYEVHQETDEDGASYHHEGEAVDALRLAAAAPELLHAVMTVKAFLDRLETGTDVDDPLLALRRKIHAPLHEAINAALAKAGANEFHI